MRYLFLLLLPSLSFGQVIKQASPSPNTGTITPAAINSSGNINAASFTSTGNGNFASVTTTGTANALRLISGTDKGYCGSGESVSGDVSACNAGSIVAWDSNGDGRFAMKRTASANVFYDNYSTAGYLPFVWEAAGSEKMRLTTSGALSITEGLTFSSGTYTGATPITFSTFTATYSGGSAYLCVNNAGQVFVSEAACP